LRQTRQEYDDDSVSVTSSQSEIYDSDEEFLVERILAEKSGDDGDVRFLILWANFPEEKATWEPERNIQDPDILQVWKKRKDQEANGIESPFDYVRFDSRAQQRIIEKEKRYERRKDEKKRVSIPVSHGSKKRRQGADDSDSTEAVESDGIPEDSSPEVKQRSKAPQKSKKHSKSSVGDSYESEEPDDVGTSDDSLIGELRQNKRKKAKKAELRAMQHRKVVAEPDKSGSQDNVASKNSFKVSCITNT